MATAEHRIRLRGGWDCLYRESEDEAAPEILRRVDLPLASPRELPARFRLARQFGRPPVDLRNESVCLELRNMPGLRSARLNGRPIGQAAAGSVEPTIELPEPLLPRNGLVLEVEGIVVGADDHAPWGEIALVIRPR
ncbi:MAG TPA: hypothetical protein VGH33_01725 [Isosphaeraceae bacterium]|jgi:hypothetical protein